MKITDYPKHISIDTCNCYDENGRKLGSGVYYEDDDEPQYIRADLVHRRLSAEPVNEKWEQRRYELAKECYFRLMDRELNIETRADMAVRWADELLRRLS